jgi:hypothetical protein
MICVPCKKIYRPERNGVHFQEMMPIPNSMEPDPATGWSSYKLWVGDRWKCPGCGHEIIGGIPQQPIAEHYQAEYRALLQEYQAREDVINVADCGPLQGGQAGYPQENQEPNVKRIAEIIQDVLEAATSLESAMLNAREELKELEVESGR